MRATARELSPGYGEVLAVSPTCPRGGRAKHSTLTCRPIPSNSGHSGQLMLWHQLGCKRLERLSGQGAGKKVHATQRHRSVSACIQQLLPMLRKAGKRRQPASDQLSARLPGISGLWRTGLTPTAPEQGSLFISYRAFGSPRSSSANIFNVNVIAPGALPCKYDQPYTHHLAALARCCRHIP